ncbi:MAG: glycosyltransferase family 2 protein [Acidobacteriota bacterium]|nr:glycosyltransferase family 2 protein [Acidobacteriota bacterium]
MTPFLSVLIPCRNEVRSLGRCLASIVASDYPAGRMEVLVVDGASTDGTREVIAHWAAAHSCIRRLENPAGSTPAALNLGVAAARGDVIARVDAHAALGTGYLTRAVEYLEASGADHVGGAMRTRAQRDGPWAGAVVAALTHPFGVGGSQFRIRRAESGEEPRSVDTVFCGCWRREIFERIGRFNEQLTRGQDMEFNQRLRRSGGKILLAPELTVEYYARAELWAYAKHNWSNGVWAVLPFAYCRGAPVRARHLAPLALIVAILITPWTAAVYGAANLAASAHVAWAERRWRYLLQMPVAFASLHLPYGAGSLWGVLRVLAMRVGRSIRWVRVRR